MCSDRVSVVLFEGFELLDVFGPAELFSLVPDMEVDYLGPERGPVRSAQGAEVIAQRAYAEVRRADILLVPGGCGTRALVNDAKFLSWLRGVGDNARIVCSVCTGATLLAAAGLLEGLRATTNKSVYVWATSYGEHITWLPAARWVTDGNRWTSSGVAAGMDMAAALIADLRDPATAQRATDEAELDVHHDSAWDPFAVGIAPSTSGARPEDA